MNHVGSLEAARPHTAKAHSFRETVTRANTGRRCRSLVAPLAVLLLIAAPASVAPAQTVFRIEADAAQAGPGTTSANKGSGILFVDPATRFIRYRIDLTGITGTYIGSHLHFGAPAVNGPIRVTLEGTPPLLAGTAVLAPSELAELLAGDLYMNVHTDQFLGGEVRGQVVPGLWQAGLVASGGEVLPPTSSTGSARGTIHLQQDGSAGYHVEFHGLAGVVTGAELRRGRSGEDGIVLATLALATPPGTSGVFSGTTAPLNAKDMARLRAGHLNVVVQSAAFPAGELRGQIGITFDAYGDSCNGGATLSGSGLPVAGESIVFTVEGGMPGAQGVLLAGLQGSDLLFPGGCHLYVGAAPALQPFPALDGSGSASLAVHVPPGLPLPLNLQLQHFTPPAQPHHGLGASNGLSVLLR